MAKAQKEKEKEKTSEPINGEDLALALRAIQDITGCGEPEAKDRATQLGGKVVAQIAELERSDKRTEIIVLLYA